MKIDVMQKFWYAIRLHMPLNLIMFCTERGRLTDFVCNEVVQKVRYAITEVFTVSLRPDFLAVA